ncbi:MAG: lysylphosphatidylglycerol synthase transmembrane domain-containing protein [Hyphomicrobiales bacterium]|nr:lysylphosphatidylglycerol synthase transmembrane domain-containing protein [Hyphomicrobiales bacterium]
MENVVISVNTDGLPRTTSVARSKARTLQTIIGVVISICCIAFMVWRIDFRQVGIAIASFHWPYLLVGLAALLVGYTARILRWSLMLRATGAVAPFRVCAAPFLGSIALNNVLPARLGDVVRALVFPSALGITKTVSTGSLVLERLTDLASVLCFLMIAIIWHPEVAIPDTMKWSAAALVVFTLAGLVVVVLLSGPLSRMCMRLSESSFGRSSALLNKVLGASGLLLVSFGAMSRLRVFAPVLLLSAIVWAGEAGLFWSFLAGFDITFSLASAALVMGIATLATLVPSSPGYVGPFHLAAYAATTILGSSADVAASFAVLAHAGIWLPTTLAGAVAILANPRLFSGVDRAGTAGDKAEQA